MKRTNHPYPEATKQMWTFRHLAETFSEKEELVEFYQNHNAGHDNYVEGHGVHEGIEIFQRMLDQEDEDYILVKMLQLRHRNKTAFCSASKLVDSKYKKYFARRDTLQSVMGRLMLGHAFSKKAGSYIAIKKPIVITNRKDDMRVTITGCFPFPFDYRTIIALNKLMYEKGFSLLKNGMLYFNATLTEICAKMKMINPLSEKQHSVVVNSMLRLRSCGMKWERKDKKGKWHLISIGGILAAATTLHPETSNGELGISFHLDHFRLFDFGYLPITDVIHTKKLTGEEIQFYVHTAAFHFNRVFGGEHGREMCAIYDDCMKGSRKPPSDADKIRKIKELVNSLETKEMIRWKKIDKRHRLKFAFTSQAINSQL